LFRQTVLLLAALILVGCAAPSTAGPNAPDGTGSTGQTTPPPGTSDGVSGVTDTTARATAPGIDDRASGAAARPEPKVYLWDDVPLYPGEQMPGILGDDLHYLTVHGADSSVVQDWYERELTLRGWTLAETITRQESVTRLFTRQYEYLSVSTSPLLVGETQVIVHRRQERLVSADEAVLIATRLTGEQDWIARFAPEWKGDDGAHPASAAWIVTTALAPGRTTVYVDALTGGPIAVSEREMNH
jgi:hypothetical protein